ncbi:formate C-acetyltransferase/glycerol dehydratase family glycyl radical enzyme [Bacillus canaveralius]|uniref:Formate C-acetyltransferase/glycerol dehydratase family glycyl radical enzyme n=1 Tax=Bacillus canaveralius TaxID=1403243 RepID=A0A2N5GSG5_9BACI|nr:formate C-acetyltransferase/glycerol dehydratase family glycyl radical enzyme [Bacillus canaveralius]PLR92818.1 formate C-acetyltransferase/glycerol dehydratase family glycyl radical enzyme [Bacillus canaveralius]
MAVKEPLHYQIDTAAKHSKRIEEMLNYVNSVRAGICIERARYVTESYRQTENLPYIMRRAKALENTLKNMTLYILPGSLLVGNQASKPNSSPLFPEFTVDFLEEEIFEGKPYFPDERPADKFEVDKNTLSELKETLEWWHGRTHKEKVYAMLSEEAVLSQDSIGAVNIVNFLHGGDGHLSPPYDWLFEHGLRYMIDQCTEKLKQVDFACPEGMEKKRFYEASIVSMQAVIDLAQRYARLAEIEAEKNQDQQRKLELRELARICRKVPEHPADSFHEALQFMTFVQFAIQIEDNAQGICPGRFDQVLLDHYQHDIAAGVITREEALELVQNFFVCLSTVERIRSWEDTDYFRGKPIFQNMTIGGTDPETGLDATNELTYLVLDAIANTRTVQPSHYARWHKGAPEKYKMKVAEVIRLGTGFPAISNDDLYIPAMLNRGYEYQDAADYCIVGCAEPGVAGLRGGRTGAAWFCLAKVFEMALYNGFDTRSNVSLNPNQNGKDLTNFESFEELWSAFEDQAKYYVKLAVIMDNTTDKLWEEYMEEPLTSVLGCPTTTIERGRSLKRGGAKYDFSGNETIGLANVANSLYAIKQLVFEQKQITGAQLLHALKTDFSDITTNPTGPEIQQMCLTVPKYGNDIDEVDYIARDVLALICEEFPKYKNTRYGRGPIGGVFQASTTTVSSNTPFGRITGTLPDGRKRGTPVSDGQSPMRGTDTEGPTAAVKSVSKIRNVILSEGSLYNLKFLPQDLKD